MTMFVDDICYNLIKTSEFIESETTKDVCYVLVFFHRKVFLLYDIHLHR